MRSLSPFCCTATCYGQQNAFQSKPLCCKMYVLTTILMYVLQTSFSSANSLSSTDVQYPYKNSGLHERDCFAGKICEYKIPEDKFFCGVQTYAVSSNAEHLLPKWLWLSEEKGSLLGIPSEKDEGISEILIVGLGNLPNNPSGHICGSVTLKITVWSLRHFPLFAENSLLKLKIAHEYPSLACGFNEAIILASLVLPVNFYCLTTKEREGFFEAFSRGFRRSFRDAFLVRNEPQNPFLDLLESSHLVASGPGANRSATGPTTLLTWHVKCGVVHMGDPLFEELKQLSQNWSYSRNITQAVIGWHVITGFTKRYLKYGVIRRRRNVFGGTTTPVYATTPISTATVVATRLLTSKTSYVSPTTYLTRPQPSPTFSSPLGRSSSSVHPSGKRNSSSSQYSLVNSSSEIFLSRNLSTIISHLSSSERFTFIQPSFTSTPLQPTATVSLTPSSRYGIFSTFSRYGTLVSDTFSSSGLQSTTVSIPSYMSSIDINRTTLIVTPLLTLNGTSSLQTRNSSVAWSTTHMLLSSNSSLSMQSATDTLIASSSAQIPSFTEKYKSSSKSNIATLLQTFSSADVFSKANGSTAFPVTVNQSGYRISSSASDSSFPLSVIPTHVSRASNQLHSSSYLFGSSDNRSTASLGGTIMTTHPSVNRTAYVNRTTQSEQPLSSSLAFMSGNTQSTRAFTRSISSVVRTVQPTRTMATSESSVDRSTLLTRVYTGNATYIDRTVQSTPAFTSSASSDVGTVQPSGTFASSVYSIEKTSQTRQPLFNRSSTDVNVTARKTKSILVTSVSEILKTSTRQLINLSSVSVLKSSVDGTSDSVYTTSGASSTPVMSTGFSLTSGKHLATSRKTILRTSEKISRQPTTILATSSEYLASDRTTSTTTHLTLSQFSLTNAGASRTTEKESLISSGVVNSRTSVITETLSTKNLSAVCVSCRPTSIVTRSLQGSTSVLSSAGVTGLSHRRLTSTVPESRSSSSETTSRIDASSYLFSSSSPSVRLTTATLTSSAPLFTPTSAQTNSGMINEVSKTLVKTTKSFPFTVARSYTTTMALKSLSTHNNRTTLSSSSSISRMSIVSAQRLTTASQPSSHSLAVRSSSAISVSSSRASRLFLSNSSQSFVTISSRSPSSIFTSGLSLSSYLFLSVISTPKSQIYSSIQESTTTASPLSSLSTQQTSFQSVRESIPSSSVQSDIFLSPSLSRVRSSSSQSSSVIASSISSSPSLSTKSNQSVVNSPSIPSPPSSIVDHTVTTPSSPSNTIHSALTVQPSSSRSIQTSLYFRSSQYPTVSSSATLFVRSSIISNLVLSSHSTGVNRSPVSLSSLVQTTISSASHLPSSFDVSTVFSSIQSVIVLGSSSLSSGSFESTALSTLSSSSELASSLSTTSSARLFSVIANSSVSSTLDGDQSLVTLGSSFRSSSAKSSKASSPSQSTSVTAAGVSPSIMSSSFSVIPSVVISTPSPLSSSWARSTTVVSRPLSSSASSSLRLTVSASSSLPYSSSAVSKDAASSQPSRPLSLLSSVGISSPLPPPLSSWTPYTVASRPITSLSSSLNLTVRHSSFSSITSHSRSSLESAVGTPSHLSGSTISDETFLSLSPFSTSNYSQYTLVSNLTVFQPSSSLQSSVVSQPSPAFFSRHSSTVLSPSLSLSSLQPSVKSPSSPNVSTSTRSSDILTIASPSSLLHSLVGSGALSSLSFGLSTYDQKPLTSVKTITILPSSTFSIFSSRSFVSSISLTARVTETSHISLMRFTSSSRQSISLMTSSVPDISSTIVTSPLPSPSFHALTSAITLHIFTSLSTQPSSASVHLSLSPSVHTTSMRHSVRATTDVGEAKSQTSSSLPGVSSLATVHLSSSSVLASSSSVVPAPTTSSSSSPKLYNSFDLLAVFVGKVFSVQIPEDTFHDAEDGNTRNLLLTCVHSNYEPLSRGSWLQFNSSTQTLYGIALKSQMEEIRKSSSDYILVARDRDGNKAHDAFTIDIRDSDEQLAVSSTIRIVGTSLEKFEENLRIMLLLVRKIAEYYGDEDESLIRVDSLKDGSVLFTWSNVTMKTCNQELINDLVSMIATKNGYIRPAFYNAMVPAFVVEEVYTNRTGPCVTTSTTKAPAVAQASSHNNSLWLKYVLPALVVALLIVILAVTCFVVRRHTGVKVLKEDKRTFKRRKPTILDEELELSTISGKPVELPDDSLTPIRYPRETALTKPTDDDEEDFPGWLSPILPSPAYNRIPPRYQSSRDNGGYSTPPPPYKLPPSY